MPPWRNASHCASGFTRKPSNPEQRHTGEYCGVQQQRDLLYRQARGKNN